MPMSLRNDAFGFKKAERLPDGRAADAEFLGEQLLEKPVAGPVFPERNLGVNPLDDLVDKLRIGSRVRHSVSLFSKYLQPIPDTWESTLDTP